MDILPGDTAQKLEVVWPWGQATSSVMVVLSQCGFWILYRFK